MISCKAICRSVIVSLVALFIGCHLSRTAAQSSESSAKNTILQLHWAGKSKVSNDTNSSSLINVWNLPESMGVETQALEELSIACARHFFDRTNESSIGLLLPVLRDVVQSETYIEVRQPAGLGNQAAEMVLAIRLTKAQAGVWDTNLAKALKSAKGAESTLINHGLVNGESGWSFKKHQAPNLFEVTHTGEWTVVGLGQDQNKLFEQVLELIRKTASPATASLSNAWLQARVDLPRLAWVMGSRWVPPAHLSTVSVAVSGAEDNVRTTGDLTFSGFATERLEPWAIPTNFIQTDLTSFTAARGVAPLLKSLPLWNELSPREAPNQFCVWALFGFPMQTYFAWPMPQASNVVSRLSDAVIEKGGIWMKTNGNFRFDRATAYNGLKWSGWPYMMPFLLSTNAMGQEFAFGGLFQPEANFPATAEVFNGIYSRTNLVYYDWELTGKRNEQLIYICQFLRMSLEKPQLPSSSPGILWLKALITKLGGTVTVCNATGTPGEFSFARKSTIGLTAIELQMLAVWLQSMASDLPPN